jgi:hypothetical protein
MAGNSVTIREMEDVSRAFGPGGTDFSLSGDLGNIIDITDSSDVLGLNMLANQAKISVSTGGSGSGSSNTINIPAPMSQSMGGGMSEIELAPLESLETINLNVDSGPVFGTNIPEVQITKETGNSLFSNTQTATGPDVSLSPSTTRRNPEEEKKEKIEYLNKLQRLEAKGFPVSRRYTMDNSLDEVKQEYMRLVDARNLEASLRFQRQALMGVVTGIEWLNDRFDPFDLNLDGWSEQVHENQEDFDEIFEELYDKYKDRGKMPPEARLIFALAGSGFMCHVSNTFMRQRLGQGMDNVLKNNPELARQFAQAAANEAGAGFGNFMGMAMNGPQPAPVSTMQANGLASPPAAFQQQQQAPTGAFFGSSRQQGGPTPQPLTPQVIASVEPPRATARREMKGPSGVDDILKTFEEIRRAEAVGSFEPANMSNSIPPAMNNSQPAVQLAQEMESVRSGDIESQAESTRTGRGGGRRKRAPIGNVLSLNV